MNGKVQSLVKLWIFGILVVLLAEVTDDQVRVLHGFLFVLRVVKVEIGQDIKLDRSIQRLDALDNTL